MGIEVSRRSEIIDFVRGIVIIDMMLVHYKDSLNIIPGLNLSKLIGYTDFAIEGFVFLAGLMVGRHYFEKFRDQPAQVIKRLVQRSAELLAIYYIMVLSISLPLALLIGTNLTGGEKPSVYIVRSLLLQNQVGLLHILPTFIPLFLIAIPILYLLKKGYDLIGLVISLCFFVLGNFDPYIFNVGDKTIFPVVLWQIYFVAGVLLGKRRVMVENWSMKKKYVFLLVSLIVFTLGSLLYHGHHIYPFVSKIRDQFGIKVSKFPLNYWGLLHYGSIFSVVVSLTALFWNKIQHWRKFVNTVTLFGRRSLLTFVIHVYFAKSLIFTTHILGNPSFLSKLIIIANFCFTLMFLRYIEGIKFKERGGGGGIRFLPIIAFSWNELLS